MIIDDQTFRAEFNKITNTKRTNQFWHYEAAFILDRTDYFPVVNVITLHREGRYDSDISDHYFVELQITKAVYFSLLEANRKLLKLELRKTVTSISGYDHGPSVRMVETFSAFITDMTSEAVETRAGKLTNDYRDNLTDLMEIHVQLTEVGFMEFLQWDVHGTYRNVKLDDLIIGMMSQPLETLKNEPQKSFGVTMEPAHNVTRFYQLRIDAGKSLAHLPSRIQADRGVYSAGIGQYFRNKMWWIWPLYDVKRYDQARRRLTVISVPPNEMMGVTESYAVIDLDLYVYATGDTKHIDQTDKFIANNGTGFRFANAGNVMDKYTSTLNGVTKVNGAQNVVPFTFDDRDQDFNNIKPSEVLLSANPWRDASKIIMGLGNLVIVNWENSDDSLLIPGMPLKYIFKKGTIPYFLSGTLLGVTTDTKTKVRSPLDKKYVSTSTLILYVERVTI